ncbi:hypothetical protein TW95_gp1006 [Pandoravirus inopinatum]|uniref:Uncharacterized protein n=1 Tax=Pandoravirus inopinatum TaxID=1605721 RepID=A0A0B5J7C1_9VIRU|nr:hypothetical protein TW95_gp1006 [Pandoravirus inopinatum]AJF97740.1 hypothetical protein [Pandoravirus inopinatum]
MHTFFHFFSFRQQEPPRNGIKFNFEMKMISNAIFLVQEKLVTKKDCGVGVAVLAPFLGEIVAARQTHPRGDNQCRDCPFSQAQVFWVFYETALRCPWTRRKIATHKKPHQAIKGATVNN